jgi:hypothetical protein
MKLSHVRTVQCTVGFDGSDACEKSAELFQEVDVQVSIQVLGSFGHSLAYMCDGPAVQRIRFVVQWPYAWSLENCPSEVSVCVSRVRRG